MGIRLYWQARIRRDGDSIRVLDSNGVPGEGVPVDRMSYGSPMVLAGEVRVDDEFLGVCGAVKFSKFVQGVMRHMSALVSLGYGDAPEDIVDAFNDRDFVIGDRYRFVGDMEPFVGLTGETCEVSGAGVISFPERTGGASMDLDTDDLVSSFVIATVPV